MYLEELDAAFVIDTFLLPADGDGLLARGQRLLPPPQLAQPDRQVVHRAGQAIGGGWSSAEGVCPVLGNLLAGEGGCSLRPAAPQLGQRQVRSE